MSTPDAHPIEHTLPRREYHAALTAPAHHFGWQRILVALDGTATTDAALHAVQTLARANHCAVDVAVTYTPRIPLPASPSRHGLDACEREERLEAAKLVRAVRRHCHTVIPNREEREHWQFHLEVGDPGAVVVRLAADVHADLAIVGLAQRDPFDTISGERTAVCAARYAEVPVLAAASLDASISRAIVVLPNGRLHAATFRAALATVTRPAKLWVVFPEGSASSNVFSDSGALRDAVRILGGASVSNALDDVRFERVVAEEDLLSCVLRLAQDLDVQIIAIPNHGEPGPVRSFLPNLAEPLLVLARCSVLVVPDESSSAH